MKEQAQLKPEHEMLMNAHAAGVQHPEVLCRLAPFMLRCGAGNSND